MLQVTKKIQFRSVLRPTSCGQGGTRQPSEGVDGQPFFHLQLFIHISKMKIGLPKRCHSLSGAAHGPGPTPLSQLWAFTLEGESPWVHIGS